MKYVSADEAVKLVRSGDTVVFQGGTSVPVILQAALARRHEELRGVQIVSGFNISGGPAPFCKPEYKESFLINSIFISADQREHVAAGYGSCSVPMGVDVRVEHDVIRPEEEMRSRRVLDALERSAGDWLKGDRAQSFSSFAAEQMDTQQAQLGSAAEEILSRIGEAYAVLEKCPRGRSALLYLTTDLGGDDALGQLLQQYECAPWLHYSRELLQEE